RSRGDWIALRGAVVELRRRAPDHPRLPDLEGTLADRDARIERSRKRWEAALGSIDAGARPDDLRKWLGEFAETEKEFRASLLRAADRLNLGILGEAREIAAAAPRGPPGLSTELKARPAAR